MLTHGFHDPRELDQLRSRAAAQPVPAAEPVHAAPTSAESGAVSHLEAGLAEMRAENANLKKQIADLLSRLNTLQGEVAALKQALGV